MPDAGLGAQSAPFRSALRPCDWELLWVLELGGGGAGMAAGLGGAGPRRSAGDSRRYALARWALNDARGALRIVRRARTLDPLSPMFMLHEASYLLRTDQFEEAAARCRSVIQTHPDMVMPYFSLAESAARSSGLTMRSRLAVKATSCRATLMRS